MNKLEGFPFVYYISLEESEDRRDHLHNQFKQYNITNLHGIISKRFKDSEDYISGNFIDSLSDSSKGSIVSHVKCLNHYIQNNASEPYVFVCEDDLSLETVQYWDFTWEQFINSIGVEWDVLQLLVVRDDFENRFEFRKREWNDWAVAAYVIKKEYAEKLVNQYYDERENTYHFNIHIKHENREDFLQPIGENVIYAYSDKVYSIPLFVEEVYKFNTTLDRNDKKYNYNEECGQQKSHITSYHQVIDWWKTDTNIKENQEMSIISKYAQDTENPSLNYEIARWYHLQGQTAAAISYYLRCADRTENETLIYECLMHMADCFHQQGNRHFTVRSLYRQAISILPKRPEAYFFLARFDEWNSCFSECYTNCSVALNVCDFSLEKISSLSDYPGKYGLIFEKAISSYWWGKNKECRALLRSLVDQYWNEMSSTYQKLVEDNLSRLGLTEHSQAFIRYNSSLYERLRFKFNDSEKITENYSQVMQDIFVLSMLNGKSNGTFLEIGGGDSRNGSNTRLLEDSYNWKGITIELDENFCKTYTDRNNTNLLNINALYLDYDQIMSDYYDSDIIDYLQLDIEPARNTYACLLKIPFDKFKFRVITYEHDDYIDVTKSCRQLSRDYLKSKGYLLIVNDISPEGVSNFEDWWVHPDLVDSEIIQRMISIQKSPHNIYDYMFNSQWYAEFETDRYIRENYYPDYEYKGVFVDVGAGPPSFISNSKHFRMHGWRTLCVEPNPKFIQQHLDNMSEVYGYACSTEECESKFVINYNNDHWYTEENDGVSFSALDIKYQDVPTHNYQETITVQTIRLDTLLESHNISRIDILSVDVEGWEIEVLKGLSLEKYQPKVVILENFESNPEYDEYMKSQSYQKDAELGYNIIYSRSEITHA